MNRRRSLLSVKKQERWTHSEEWTAESGVAFSQSPFKANFEKEIKYDEQHNLILDVSGTANKQITPSLAIGAPKKTMWECVVNIQTPSEVNGFKITLYPSNAGVQIYIIKSDINGYASVMYDDGITNEQEHNLANGVFIKDIVLNSWNTFKMIATPISLGKSHNEIYINGLKVYETENASKHYANMNRVMWQNAGYGLLRSIKYAYLEA